MRCDKVECGAVRRSGVDVEKLGGSKMQPSKMERERIANEAERGTAR